MPAGIYAHEKCSSNHSRDPPLHPQGPDSQTLEIQLLVVFRHVLSACNAMDLHARIVFQVGQKFRRDQEILRSVLGASDVDHAGMDKTMGMLV